MTGAGEAGARTDRNHVDDAAIAVDDHHLVLHDEEAIVAIGREHVDQRRIGRDRGDGHARRDGDAGANLEVDRARVDMRNVVRLQNRLLQRRALLRRHVLAALGLDLAVGRGLALGLTLRVGRAPGRVLVGAGVRIPVLSALAGSALLAIGPAVSLCICLALVLRAVFRPLRIVALGLALTGRLLVLLAVLLRTVLAAVALLLAGVARAVGAATLRTGLLALSAAGLAAACGGPFGPAAVARFGPTSLRCSFVVGSAFATGCAAAHSASGMTTRRNSLFARCTAGAAARAAAHALRGHKTHASQQYCG